MAIHVEFYGIPRQRAGTARVDLETPEQGITLGEALQMLAARFPRLAEDCISQDGTSAAALRLGYAANRDGDEFLTEPQALLKPNQCLLIMSADAGG